MRKIPEKYKNLEGQLDEKDNVILEKEKYIVELTTKYRQLQDKIDKLQKKG